MEDCIFCKIVAGEIPASKIYEDEDFLAFLTINPTREGHTLVVPKKHVSYVVEMTNDDYLKMMKVVKTLTNKINDLLKPERMGMQVIGYDVAHTHVHIVPLFERGDMIELQKIPQPTREELEATAEKIRSGL